MKARLAVAVIILAGAIPSWAQFATVKGKIVDISGKPVAGAVVQLSSTDTGSKYTLKVNDKGQYFSMGILPGSYNVTVTKDGRVIDSAQSFRVTSARAENVLDFDQARSAAAAEAKLSAEEKAKQEAAAKETQKLQGLNDLLAAARAASQTGNYDQAVSLLRQATETDATHDLLWAQLGDAYLNAGKHAPDKTVAANDFQQSVAALKRALEIKPAEGKYYNTLGEAYVRLGQTPAAVQQYQLAAQKDPADAARYYFNEGAVLTNAGHLDEANAAFDKAIAANPNYAEAYYQKAINLLGKAQLDPKTGTMIAPPEVATGLNKYLELTPTGPNAASAEALLASLGSKIETSYGKGKKK
jgi:tetratricopeptide (TPR) repeat protein